MRPIRAAPSSDQFHPTFFNRLTSSRIMFSTIEVVRRAADRNTDLLLLPEFCFVPGVLAEPGPGVPSNPNAFRDALTLYAWSGTLFEQWLCRMSQATGMLVGAATLTARRGWLFNTGLLADETGRIALRYDKIHLPFDEAVQFRRAADMPQPTPGWVGSGSPSVTTSSFPSMRPRWPFKESE